jgi:hypothetical protein
VQRIACKWIACNETRVATRKHDLQLLQAGLKPVQERWLSYQVIYAAVLAFSFLIIAHFLQYDVYQII